LSKKALLKEYTEEIERLRRDLLASRERNGVYLAQENYNDMQSLIENQTKEIEEKITHIKVLQETMEAKEVDTINSDIHDMIFYIYIINNVTITLLLQIWLFFLANI
jgi:FKBP-type peptidyl-prolyl cis-trans isomerase (trigger factor)